MTQRKMASSVVVGLTATVLSGCFPYMISYVHLDGPGVTYKRAPCRDGAPVAVAYEKSGARFEVTLEPHNLSSLQDAYLKVRAPRDVVVSIPDPTALFKFRSPREGTSISVQLKAAQLDWHGPFVEELRRNSPLAEYRFVFVAPPPIDSPGTLHLPVVLLDGVAVEAPVLTFERRPYAGIAPLNC